MTERLVDVLDGRETVCHTFPITINGPHKIPDDADFQDKALVAAACAHLVADENFSELTTRMHVSRKGRLAPYGDSLDIYSETRSRLHQHVRERAFALWQRGGSPLGQSEKYWHQACTEHYRERAYFLWRQEGCPNGRADEHWHRVQAFECD